jgi:hypothetical protein
VTNEEGITLIYTNMFNDFSGGDDLTLWTSGAL